MIGNMLSVTFVPSLPAIGAALSLSRHIYTPSCTYIGYKSTELDGM